MKDKNLNPPRIVQYCENLAVFSGGFGFFLMLTFLITRKFMLIYMGITYLTVSVIINLMFLSALVISYLNNDDIHRKKTLRTVGLMLLNIPFSILCFYLVVTSF